MIILGFAPEPDRSGFIPQSRTHAHLVLVFGVGMIGHAIVDALYRLGFQHEADIPYSWDDAQHRKSAAQRVEAVCCDWPQGRKPRLSLVWSAGRAGFHSSEPELLPEAAAFEDVLGLIGGLRESLRPPSLDVHFISSAGGLFEGQEGVSLASRPVPVRPYGMLKLRQEYLLAERLPPNEVAIYRPSSVYGPHFSGSRHGLINHLVSNSRRGRVTVLDAHVMALRDYVYSGDIGRYIARAIHFGLDPDRASPVYFLVSSRCASIFEVVGKIERVLKLKIPFRIDENFGNHRNITFSERVLPAGWHPSPLEVGIRQFTVHPAG